MDQTFDRYEAAKAQAKYIQGIGKVALCSKNWNILEMQ